MEADNKHPMENYFDFLSPGPDDIRIAAGHHIPEGLLLRRGASLGQVIEQLYLPWVASDAEEYVDRLLYLPM